jgi:hypothetical protein
MLDDFSEEDYSNLAQIDVYGNKNNGELKQVIEKIDGLNYVDEGIDSVQGRHKSGYGKAQNIGIGLKPNPALVAGHLASKEEIFEALESFLNKSDFNKVKEVLGEEMH